MANKQTVPDEQIIAALLAHGTIKAAAEAVNLSERAIYDRMNTGALQALYKAAKADLIRAAVFNINNKLDAAIETVSEIMNNPDNNAAVRLQAAQTILNNAAKFTQRLQIDETGVINQLEDNAMRYIRI